MEYDVFCWPKNTVKVYRENSKHPKEIFLSKPHGKKCDSTIKMALFIYNLSHSLLFCGNLKCLGGFVWYKIDDIFFTTSSCDSHHFLWKDWQVYYSIWLSVLLLILALGPLVITSKN